MFGDLANRLRTGRNVVLVHGNADMDALGSAYALKHAFPNTDIFAPNGIDRVCKVVTEKIEVAILEECDLDAYDHIVIVDTSSPDQLDLEGDVPKEAIIIDHHIPTGKWDGYEIYCDENRTSCCEIIKDLLDEFDIELDRDTALMLIGGMITDSGHFEHAKPELLITFADVMKKYDICMDEAYNLTQAPMSMSERIAVMKAMERIKFDRVGTMIVATSYGGSFEASSCKAIITAGADVAFVGSQRDDEFRISARATQESVRKGIDVGNLMKGIGKETMSDGGGHAGAAGLSGIGDTEALLSICMSRTMEVFRDIKAKDLLEKKD